MRDIQVSDAATPSDEPAVPAALDDEMLEVLGEFLQESAENLDRVDGELVALEARPGDVELLSSVFRTMHTIKGTCGFFGFAALERVTHSAENLLVRLRDGEIRADARVADALLASVDAVRGMLDAIAADGHEGEADHAELVARLTAIASDPERAPEPDARSATAPIAEPPPEPPAQPPAARDPTLASARDRSNAPDASIRVDVPVLDALMDLVGELVLSRNQIVASVAPLENDHAHAAAHALDLITTDLQATVMRTRMQSVDTLWTRLPRVVRDLAQGCGKRVRVEMHGRDTELDRGLLEAIKDPLTHLVRNCVDHGIEKPEARTAAGKDPEGLLTLRARHEGGQVLIEIGDDGAGIDPDRLVAKAVANGVVDAARAASMSDAERVRLIFLAGLSTAEAVTNLSGRGVGMDVVKTNIERIDGSIDVASTRGGGTLFRLRVPLTLAIVPALVVESAGARFAIPQVNLAELLNAAGGDARVEDLHGAPVLRLRGSLLPVICLSTLLGHEPGGGRASQHIAVLSFQGVRFGLRVERIRDAQEIVVKPLSEALRGAGVYAGATIMGDGCPALVLDVPGIAERGGLDALDHACGLLEAGGRGASGPASAADRIAVLLVRDTAGEHAAVPLAGVDRLERIETSRVETSGGSELVRYRDGLLPLRALDGAGASDRHRRVARRRATEAPAGDALQVVVLAVDGRWLGLCVTAILDVESVAAPAPARVDAPFARAATVETDEAVARLIDVPALLARHGDAMSGTAVSGTTASDAVELKVAA